MQNLKKINEKKNQKRCVTHNKGNELHSSLEQEPY